MNIKNKLNQYAKDDLIEYENEQFFKSLKAKVEDSSMGKQKKPIKPIFISSLIALFIMVLCIGIFLWTPWSNPENETPERMYLLEDEIIETATLQEVQLQLKTIQFSDGKIISVDKTINSHYEEVLYYIIRYEFDEFTHMNVYLCTNERYAFDSFNHLSYDSNEELLGNKLEYVEIRTLDDELYSFETKGEIEIENYKVFIEYTEIGFEETSNFIGLLRSIIK